MTDCITVKMIELINLLRKELEINEWGCRAKTLSVDFWETIKMLSPSLDFLLIKQSWVIYYPKIYICWAIIYSTQLENFIQCRRLNRAWRKLGEKCHLSDEVEANGFLILTSKSFSAILKLHFPIYWANFPI